MRLIVKEALFILAMLALACVLLYAAPRCEYPMKPVVYMLAAMALSALALVCRDHS